ncbi:hypothetical protein [Jannaschia formosa]|uniref:hypothetical protein n=1 Tax=Jannaschia formosa TaxID=2259592 RepID=UPI00143091C9|nr:hypothetical protein [Jannaschia formosa]
MDAYATSVSHDAVPDFSGAQDMNALIVIVHDWAALTEQDRRAGIPRLARTYFVGMPTLPGVSIPLALTFAQPEVSVVLGGRTFEVGLRPRLSWPGATQGAIQLFHHDDWPGCYGSANVNPQFWNGRPAPLAAVVTRARLLPHLPIRLPELPEDRTRAFCGVCHARTDTRFAFGHGRWNGSAFVRAGTDELITTVDDQAWIRRLDVGPVCQECIDAVLPSGDPRPGVPEGHVYVPERNRAMLPNEAPKPTKFTWPDDPDPLLRGPAWYGGQAFEWRHLEREPDILARLDRLEGRDQ